MRLAVSASPRLLHAVVKPAAGGPVHLRRHASTFSRRAVRPRPTRPVAARDLLDEHAAPHPATASSSASASPGAQHAPLPKNLVFPLVLSSLMAAGLAFYSVQLFIAARRPCSDPHVASLEAQKDVSGRYEDTADSFDSEVRISEMLMGVGRLRKRLARMCTGDVLEASCGTGRNAGYYNIDKKGVVKSLTFVDLSPAMVDVCRRKWETLFPARMYPGLTVRFLSASALDPLPLAPSGKKYDTIIQTMGLCSTAQPVELLSNLTRHLNASNPDAKILLLEHGRSYMPWLNNILDGAAEKHAEIHGCWFNRDIQALVEEAAEQNGLEVVSERRWHGGTTSVFELRWRKTPELDKTVAVDVKPGQPTAK